MVWRPLPPLPPTPTSPSLHTIVLKVRGFGFGWRVTRGGGFRKLSGLFKTTVFPITPPPPQTGNSALVYCTRVRNVVLGEQQRAVFRGGSRGTPAPPPLSSSPSRALLLQSALQPWRWLQSWQRAVWFCGVGGGRGGGRGVILSLASHFTHFVSSQVAILYARYRPGCFSFPLPPPPPPPALSLISLTECSTCSLSTAALNNWLQIFPSV